MIDEERLATDREYWDEVAPEGAVEFSCETYDYEHFWRDGNGNILTAYDVECGEDWYKEIDTDQRVDIIKRPEENEWSKGGALPSKSKGSIESKLFRKVVKVLICNTSIHVDECIKLAKEICEESE